jgi:hypothetical protein
MDNNFKENINFTTFNIFGTRGDHKKLNRYPIGTKVQSRRHGHWSKNDDKDLPWTFSENGLKYYYPGDSADYNFILIPLLKDQIWKHIKKGNEYKIIQVGFWIKTENTWEQGVMYVSEDNTFYVRPIKSFYKKFEFINN